MAEREEPGEEARKGGLSTRAWPEGLPLRGLRVITGEAAGFATAGTLTLGGCAAPLSFPSLCVPKRHEHDAQRPEKTPTL